MNNKDIFFKAQGRAAMMPIMASLPLSFSATAFDSLSVIKRYLELLVLLLRMHRLLLQRLALLPNH